MDTGSILQDDDERLLRRFRETGDNSLFSEIFRRHHRSIFLSCRNVVRDDSIAEDLTQETFIRAYKSLHQYTEGRFVAWLRQIAIYQSINWLRSPANRRTADVENQLQEPRTESGDITQTLDLENACERLPPVQRQTIELYYYEGLSYKEIAQQMGISENAVTSHLQNGRRRLRLHLEGNAS